MTDLQVEQIGLTCLAVLVPVIGPTFAVGITDGAGSQCLLTFVLSLFLHIPGAIYACCRIWKPRPGGEL